MTTLILIVLIGVAINYGVNFYKAIEHKSK